MNRRDFITLLGGAAGVYSAQTQRGRSEVAKSIRMTLTLSIACIIGVAAVAAGAATPGSEAGPRASPKLIACMAACEQTQMGCLQGATQIPPEKRTIKDINAFRTCNRAEETCDHRCRKAK
jgi:hypothetical protein